MKNEYHIPVLLNESIMGLNIRPEGIYVDATLGGGGHAAAILQRLAGGRLFAFDQDEAAWQNAPEDARLVRIRDNFRNLATRLAEHGIAQIDGLLADLGVSSHQLDDAGRGFAFRQAGTPDMRMDRRQRQTALDIILTYEVDALTELFKRYGELRNARRIAMTLVKARNKRPVTSMQELVDLLKPLAPRESQNRFLARIFQALRIEVNDEMEALRELLGQSATVIRRGGRLAVISYHSLEDRQVKNFIRTGTTDGHENKDLFGNVLRPFRPLHRKAVVPSAGEMAANPRARSARLRIAEKI